MGSWDRGRRARRGRRALVHETRCGSAGASARGRSAAGSGTRCGRGGRAGAGVEVRSQRNDAVIAGRAARRHSPNTSAITSPVTRRRSAAVSVPPGAGRGAGHARREFPSALLLLRVPGQRRVGPEGSEEVEELGGEPHPGCAGVGQGHEGRHAPEGLRDPRAPPRSWGLLAAEPSTQTASTPDSSTSGSSGRCQLRGAPAPGRPEHRRPPLGPHRLDHHDGGRPSDGRAGP